MTVECLGEGACRKRDLLADMTPSDRDVCFFSANRHRGAKSAKGPLADISERTHRRQIS